MSTELVLACHGQSAQRQGGKVLGWWADVPLSPTGHQQAVLLGERLCEAFDVTVLYTSPLRRARETAEVVGRLVRVVPQIEQNLRELDGGELTNLTFEEARTRYPDLILRGRSAPGSRIPGGESYADLHMRVQHAVGGIVRQNPGGQVVVITHGGPIVAYLRAAMGFTWDAKSKPRFACDAISVHHLRFEEAGEKTVIRLNDTVHLGGMPG